jgi:hypothetical protein
MRVPPPPIQQALYRAALRGKVPYTLLAAIAAKESSYNPAAIGPITAGGWNAKGLMQLSPDTLQRFAVADPFDAVQNASAAAQMIAHLAKGSNYDWPRVLACYCWGVGKVIAADAQHTPWPRQVVGYVETVQGNRSWLQNQAEPAGATAAERLNNAIVGLATLNPNDSAIMAMNDAWNVWFTGARRLIADSALLQQPVLIVAWRKYAELYDRAAITDSKTPPPAAIQPQLWAEIAAHVERMATDTADQVVDWAKAASSALLPAGLIVAAVVLWYFGARRDSGGGGRPVGSFED